MKTQSSLTSIYTLGALLLTSLAYAGYDDSQTSSKTYHLPKNENSGLLQCGHIDSGLVIGRITQLERRGHLFKSKEFTFNFGDLGAQDGFSSTSYGYSTSDSEIFNHLRAGQDFSKPFILKYKRSILRNPFTKGTHFNIVDVFPTYTGSNPEKAGLRLHFVEPNAPTGGYSSGTLSGRIIRVQRWGTLYAGCAVTLHLKGTKTRDVFTPETSTQQVFNPMSGRWETQALRRTLKTTKTVMNIEKLKVNSEEGCQYVESLLPFGVMVDMNFRETHFALIDHSKEVESITVKQDVKQD